MDEIYDDNSLKFNRTNLTTLLRYITGNENAGVNDETMASISTMAENATTSADIREKVLTNTEIPKSNGQDVIVTLGGLDWQVVYLSQNDSGDNVLTLWLANSTDTSSWSSGWSSNTNDVSYPCNMYGSSYIRAVTLNNGGKYAISEEELSEEQSKDATNKFARFTMEEVEGSLTDYIVKPNEIGWQQYQSAAATNPILMNYYPNDSLNNPADIGLEGRWYTSLFNYKDKEGYNAWGNDYIWLPSMAETGFNDSNVGLWKISIFQSANTGISWLRSGASNYEHSAVYLYPFGGGDLDIVSGFHAVRPAFHLNLDEVYDNITLTTITLDSQNESENRYIYQRYGVGFYSDSETMEMITSVDVPTRTGHTFKGYYTNENGSGTMVIDESGNIVVSNTFFQENRTIYALWQVNKYPFDVNAYVNDIGGENGTGFEEFTFNIYRNGDLIMSNTKDFYLYEDYGTEMTVEINSYPNGYYFDRMRYVIWDLVVETPTITVPVVDDVLKCKIEVFFYSEIYHLTLKYGNGDTDSKLYLKYDVGYFKDEACNYELTEITAPTRAGYIFGGFYTGENGSGTKIIDENGNIVAPANAFLNDTNLFAYWKSNVPAYYDEEGDYWYIEYGKMPQEKLTDGTIIALLENDNPLDDTDGVTTSPNEYYFADLMLSAKIYDGEEHCNIFGEWYKVLPIRWRLDTPPSTSGYVSTSTMAVMESVVYVGKYSQSSLNIGDGYQSANADFSYVDYFLGNFSLFEKGFLEEFSVNSEKFTASGTQSESVSGNIFLASEEEIEKLFGGFQADFSDFASDFLDEMGRPHYYFVRDLGSNLNNIECKTSGGVGGIGQRPTYMLGMRFVITVSEFVCV